MAGAAAVASHVPAQPLQTPNCSMVSDHTVPHQLRALFFVVTILLWQGYVRGFVAVEFGIKVCTGDVYEADLHPVRGLGVSDRLPSFHLGCRHGEHCAESL